MPLQIWRRLPHHWIEAKGLRAMLWRDGVGADNAAALMLLAAIVQQVDPDTGLVRLTYDGLQHITGLSRLKVSRGLSVLVGLKVIERSNPRSSEIRLLNVDAPTWAKFPTRGLYNGAGQIAFFQNLTLRRKDELYMLKLWFLLCSRRNIKTGLTELSYDKIESYSGLGRAAIRDALSLAIHHGLVVVEKAENPFTNMSNNAYRVRHIDPYAHAGTAKAETAAPNMPKAEAPIS